MKERQPVGCNANQIMTNAVVVDKCYSDNDGNLRLNGGHNGFRFAAGATVARRMKMTNGKYGCR